MRETIPLVIPSERASAQLDRSIRLIEENTQGYQLHVLHEPELNVSECRERAMRDIPGRLICFLDYDAEMVTPGWLDMLYEKWQEHDDAVAVFGAEWWGDMVAGESFPPIQNMGDAAQDGPAACMLIDRQRLPAGLSWDSRIGLRNGWLGPDCEELDYCLRILASGGRMYRESAALWHHTGGRTTLEAFCRTDRCRCVRIMRNLIMLRHDLAPEDPDWFAGLRCARASATDDRMLAGGESLRACYREVLRRNGLLIHPTFRSYGIA